MAQNWKFSQNIPDIEIATVSASKLILKVKNINIKPFLKPKKS